MINWWFLTFNSTDVFNHFRVLTFVLIVVLHIGYEPVVHLVFSNLTIVVSITFFNSSINVLLWDKSTVSVQGCSCCFLMNCQGHSNEASRFFWVQTSISIFIVLRPNLIHKMGNYLFIFTTMDELLKKLGSINSFFIWLAYERSKNKLWHIFTFNIL